MRFLMMTTGEEAAGGPPDEKVLAEMGRFIEELTRAGVLLATGGLDPHAIRIKNSGGKISVTDGPFTEAKEVVVGFALVDVRSKEEAIELSKRFWKIVGAGEGVIQQVFGPEDPALSAGWLVAAPRPTLIETGGGGRISISATRPCTSGSCGASTVAMAYGPAAGLAVVDPLTAEPSLRNYHLLPSVRGDLLEKLGRRDEARAEFERAAALTRNAPERALLRERAAALRNAPGVP